MKKGRDYKTYYRVINLILHTILIVGLIFALLPLFWMIITAFKEPGQAFAPIIPKTNVITDIAEVEPMKQDETVVCFEYLNPTAQSVSVAGDFNGWDKNKDRMTKFGDVWSIKLKELPPGKYEYKFVVNGTQWIKDPENKLERNDNSLIEVKKGINTNTVLTNQTKIDDGNLFIKVEMKSSHNVVAVINGETELPLKKEGDSDYWTGSIALKNVEDIYKGKYEYFLRYKRPFKDAFKALYTRLNFKRILHNVRFPFLNYFLNSLVVASVAGLLTVLICTFAGYAFAQKEFFFRDKIFYFLLSAMMIPGMIFMVPQYAIVTKLKWINTYQGMIIPHLANVFGLFLLRQYIIQIPKSLFQAAEIDGANELQIMRIIVVPLAMPIIVTLFLITFVFHWSNFLWQLIVNTPDSKVMTLPIGLQLFKSQNMQDWEAVMAGSCFSIIPITVLFIFAQRFFIEGLTAGSLKE